MKTESLFLLGAAEGADLVRRREISAASWADACFKRIEERDSNIHAWVYLNRALVLEQAAALDERLNQKDKLDISELTLAGVPVGVKDVFNTKEMPTCMGSPIWEGFTPGNDARVVYNLKLNGAVSMGKTVTAEFAVHAPGKTRNPFNSEYSPGTSSSGSAAAVAAFMVPLAIGTQTAGSIIRPASYCGVFGFKPSFGLIPRTGVLKTTDTLDTIGLFARSADDIELGFDSIRMKGIDYPFASEKVEMREFSQPAANGKWSVGFISDSLNVCRNFSPEAAKAFNAALDTMRGEKDIAVHDAKLPADFNSAHDIHGLIYDKTLSYYFKDEFQKHTLVSPVMYDIVKRGNAISPDEYHDAVKRQTKLSLLLDKELSKNDVVVVLSTAGSAPIFGGDDIPDTCLIWTLCGVPAINVPLFRDSKNLPFGLQVISRRYSDKRLLQFVRRLEALFRDKLKLTPPEWKGTARV